MSARSDLVLAHIENAKLEAKIDRLTDQLTVKDKTVNELEWDVRRAKDEKESYLTQVHELDKKNAVLLERLDLVTNFLPPAPTEARNHISEEQEDADYALHAGLIDRDEYEAILAQAGALNAEISFDSDTSPRL